jgi:transposase
VSELGEPFKTVNRWVKRYKETGGVDAAPKSGRKRTMTAAATERAFDLLFNEDVGGAKSAAQELHGAGLTPRLVHKTTVARAVHRMAQERGERVSILRGKPQKKLSEATVQKRFTPSPVTPPPSFILIGPVVFAAPASRPDISRISSAILMDGWGMMV